MNGTEMALVKAAKRGKVIGELRKDDIVMQEIEFTYSGEKGFARLTVQYGAPVCTIEIAFCSWGMVMDVPMEEYNSICA